MIIGLSAFAQSGKDTAADILVTERGFVKLGFADALRSFVYAADPIIGHFHDWNDDDEPVKYIRYAAEVDRIGYEAVKKDYPEAREILQRIGTEAGRKVIGDSVWVDTAFKNVYPDTNYVFADTRFPNEADAIRSRGGKVVRIDRLGVNMVNAHASETALLEYRFDYRLANDSTLEVLRERILGYVDSVE
jgi:hypothetical protein